METSLTMNRLAFGLAAVATWSIGLDGISGGGFFHPVYSRYFDFGEHNILAGNLFLFAGGVFAYFALRRSREPKAGSGSQDSRDEP